MHKSHDIFSVDDVKHRIRSGRNTRAIYNWKKCIVLKALRFIDVSLWSYSREN